MNREQDVFSVASWVGGTLTQSRVKGLWQAKGSCPVPSGKGMTPLPVPWLGVFSILEATSRFLDEPDVFLHNPWWKRLGEMFSWRRSAQETSLV